jgi:hypothetical protein
VCCEPYIQKTFSPLPEFSSVPANRIVNHVSF